MSEQDSTINLMMEILNILVKKHHNQPVMINKLLHLLVSKLNQDNRKDSPNQMLYNYEVFIARLKSSVLLFHDHNKVYNPENILDLIWETIISLFQPISAAAIIELETENNKLSYKAKKDTINCLKDWNSVSRDWINKLIHDYLNTKSVFCLNHNKTIPLLQHSTGAESLLISFLWEKPNGQKQYLLLVRKASKMLFNSQEEHAISLFSRIVGLHMGYCYLHQAFHFIT